MIPNPAPITATFTGMWIRSARIIFSDGEHSNTTAQMVAYDPDTKQLLLTGAKDVRKPLPDPLTARIIAELQRLADTERAIRVVHVSAPDPLKPVSVIIMFTEGSPHIIRDAYALAASDAAFASVFSDTMLFIAS